MIEQYLIEIFGLSLAPLIIAFIFTIVFVFTIVFILLFSFALIFFYEKNLH